MCVSGDSPEIILSYKVKIKSHNIKDDIMNNLRFHKIPFQYEGRNFDLIISESSNKSGFPASLFSLYENNKVLGNVRFTPTIIAMQKILTNKSGIYQEEIDKAAIKKFTGSDWITKVIKKNDPDFIFEDILDSL